MVFSSLFFILFFLPLNLFFYCLMPGLKAKNIEMLIFSLIFYSWGGTKVSFSSHGDGVDCLVFGSQDRQIQKKQKEKKAMADGGMCGTCGSSWYF